MIDFEIATDAEKVEHFEKKFSNIPDEKWTTGDFKSNDGKCCAYGHCGRLSFGDEYWTEESKALRGLFNQKYIALGVLSINDVESVKYPQPTPKLRILAALNDIKRKLTE